MTLDYALTIEDYIAYNLFHIQRSPTIRKQLLLSRVMVSVIVAAASLLVIANIPTSHRLGGFEYTVAAIGGLIFFFIYPRTIASSNKKRIKGMFTEGNSGGIIGERTLSLLPDGILYRTSANETKMYWHTVERIALSNDCMYIYVSALSAIIIPQRIFNDEKHMQAFIGAVQTHYHAATGNALPVSQEQTKSSF